MPRRRQPASNGVPEWVVTYGDLMSLLLTFFILLAAFSELKQPREYRDVVRAIQEAFGYKGGDSAIALEGEHANTPIINLQEEIRNLLEDKRTAEDNTERNVHGRRLNVSIIHEGQRYVIGGSIEFAPGSAELSPRARSQLKEVAEFMRDRNNVFEIRGHAYGPEDQTGGLDHIALSYQRARAAMEYLVTACGVRPLILRVQAVGNAEPQDMSEFATGVGSNRRVQIVMTEILVDELHPDPHGTGRRPADATPP